MDKKTIFVIWLVLMVITLGVLGVFIWFTGMPIETAGAIMFIAFVMGFFINFRR
jgi:hypothetical protein